jgi:uncharacterized protein YjaZ
VPTMRIEVIDTATAMRRIADAPLAERPGLLRVLMEPVRGMYRYFPGEVDLVAMHHAGSGFRVDREDERMGEGVDLLVAADAWTRVERALHDGLALQLAATPGIAVPDVLRAVLVLGDPADELFMDVSLGMTANGSVSGFLWICLWPDPENLARIEATAVHELNHNLRYCTVPWDPMTTPVGEQIVSEGLADAFARQLYGDLGYTRIGLAAQGDDAVFDEVVANLGVTGMQHFASWVHGDAIAARYGAAPVGLPTGAGYAVGNRLVDAYLAATGSTAAEALLADRDDVVRVALQERASSGTR